MELLKYVYIVVRRRPLNRTRSLISRGIGSLIPFMAGSGVVRVGRILFDTGKYRKGTLEMVRANQGMRTDDRWMIQVLGLFGSEIPGKYSVLITTVVA